MQVEAVVPALVVVHIHQVQEDPEAVVQVALAEQIAEVAEAVAAGKVKQQAVAVMVLLS